MCKLEVQFAGSRADLGKEMGTSAGLRSQLALALAAMKENNISVPGNLSGSPCSRSSVDLSCASAAKEVEMRSRAKKARVLEEKAAALENDNVHLKRIVKNLRNRLMDVQRKAAATEQVL